MYKHRAERKNMPRKEKYMAVEIARKDAKVQIRQLEALILLMAGATLASLQIVHYMFWGTGMAITAWQMLLDWIFGMSVIFLLVHFSFREILKIHNELVLQREQATRAEKRIQHIIDTTQDIIFTLDREGNFTFINKAIEEISGYTVDRVLTNSIGSLLSPEYNKFVPDQLKRYKEIAGRHLYVDLMKEDGSLVPIEFSFMPVKNRDGELIGFHGVARDVSERKEVEKAQKEKEKYLKAIARVGQILLETKKDIPYKKILEILCHTSEINNAFILLDKDNQGGDHDTGAVLEPGLHAVAVEKENSRVYVSYTDDNDKSSGTGKSGGGEIDGDGIARDMMQLSKKEGTIVSTCNDDSSSLILPIMVNSEFAGVVGFQKPIISSGFKPVEINLLATSVSMLAQTIERQNAGKQIKEQFVQLTRMISKAMFAVDPYTVTHQERLAGLAAFVGEKLGLKEEEIEWLQVGALLHDIGKAAIPNTILSKPGKLTDEEWWLIRSHVMQGYEMLQGMNLPPNVIEMVKNHHERLDGSGYPKGIRRNQLSLESRILGLCDVVEAMGSHRPYRPARKKVEIIEELQSGREKRYDARVVDVLIDIIERDEFELDYQKRELAIAMT
ncbi:MAG: PAS domain S-box protein [Dehalococcoidia bacterium]|nr:PAS domain S-box protein [Dehalococcoidia bacterium]